MNSDENDDCGEGYMKETLNKAEQSATASTYAKPDDVVRSEHGIISEVFSHDWRAEYTEDPKTGLWNVELFKHDVSKWVAIDQVSLACARECARNFYDQQ